MSTKKALWIVIGFMAIVLIATFVFSGTVTKGTLGKQDIRLWYSGTSAQTFTRTTSAGYTLTLNPLDWVGIDVHQVYSVGTTRTGTIMTTAASDVGYSTKRQMFLNPGTWAITANMNVGDYNDLYWVFAPGAVLSIDSGITATFPDPSHIIAAPTQQITSGAGTLAFSKSGIIPCGWFGVVADDDSDAGTDNATAFAAWGNSLESGSARGSVGLIPPGYYYTTGAIDVDADFVEIEAHGARIRGNNVPGYILTLGSDGASASMRKGIRVNGGEWKGAGTTTGCIAAYYCTNMIIDQVHLSGTGTNAFLGQACWVSSLQNSYLWGNFTKDIYLQIHANGYKNNKFLISHNWLHGRKYASQTHGLHIDDGSSSVKSENNYYQNMDGSSAIAISAESAFHFISMNDNFEDIYQCGQSKNDEARWMYESVNSCYNGFELQGNQGWLVVPSYLATPANKFFILSGNENNVETPTTTAAYYTDSGTDNRIFNYSSGRMLPGGTFYTTPSEIAISTNSVLFHFGINYTDLEDSITGMTFPTGSASENGQEVEWIIHQSETSVCSIAGWPSNVKIAGGSFTMTATTDYVDVLRFKYLHDITSWVETYRSQACR